MVLSDSFYYQPVQIDTINTRVNADLFAKEGDANGRGMVVQITENGIIKDTTGITLRLQWSHISVGVSGFTDFEVVDATKGLYKLVYPTSMLHRGRVEAFIRITDNGILSGTRNLLITVERMVASDETIEASDDFSALQTALIQLDAWNVTIGGKVGTWEADMEATKQLYIDTLAATEAAYPQELVLLTSQLAEKAPYSHVWGMGNLGQDVKEALTGGSVAVVGRNTVGKENIKKESVTIGKTSFTRRGLNYFDGEYIEGVALDNATTPMSLVSGLPGRMTAIVPVEGGKTYQYEGYDDTGRLAIAATKEYPNFSENAGESFVDYDLVKGVNTAKTHRVLEVPVDAKFLVINVSGDYSEPEIQISETSGFRTGYDRRINPSNGGAGTVAHLNSHFGINFRYDSSEIIIDDLPFIAFGYRYRIPLTTIPMMDTAHTSFLICYNLTTEQFVQYGSSHALRVPDDVVILGSYTKKDVRPISINGFSNYKINDTTVHMGNQSKNGLFVSRKGRLNFDFAGKKIITTGTTQVMLNGRSYLIPAQELDISGASKTESSCLYAEVSEFSVLLKYNTLYTMMLSPNQIALGTFFPLDGTVTGFEHHLINGISPQVDVVGGSDFNLKIGGIGRVNGGITSNLATEPVLASVKNTKYLSDGTLTEPLAAGFLYHGSGTDRDLYYSQNQADKLDKIGILDFNPKRYNAGIGEEGEIIWVNEDGRSVYPRVHEAGQYDSSIELTGMAKTPIAWLQNCGIDFARDANGEEYCIFGEYTGGYVGEIRVWKVTKPYRDPTNWRIVKTFNQSQIYKQGTENEVWHIHTVQHDPYTGIWYATSGDSDLETKWWYSTDEGESWTLLLSGTYWESQIARVLNFVFTKDYIYWGNDYGTNHSLNRVTRGANGVINPATRVKLAELNKNQSTYATVLTNSPKGILLLDRVDTDFSVRTNKLDVEFYSFDDNKIHVLDTLERLDNKSSYFGFRCKSYTLYQPLYDARIVVGFGTSPNWIKLPYNTNENRNALTLSIS